MSASKKTLFADVVNGIFDMDRDQVISHVRANNFFSDPSEVSMVDSDGVEYTGQDLLDMAEVENEKI